MRRVLLLDLDETLIEEEPAAIEAFEATAGFAAARAGADIPHHSLVTAVRRRARELWRSSPYYDYCLAIGISSTEGLWCRFEGREAVTRGLRAWVTRYRRSAWSSGLEVHGVRDDALADALADRFSDERRARHRVFPDVLPALRSLRDSGVEGLGLLTNGASCLQHEKIDASGLRALFDVCVVSADVGVGKPDRSIFRYTLSCLNARPAQAAMVGDSIERDVDGAVSAGLGAVWMNRLGRPRPSDRPELVEMASLAELSVALA